MQKITPFLWYDNNAEEAMNLYVSLFKNSKVLGLSLYGAGGELPEGTMFIGSITLDGLELTLMNAGPVFKFTEAISLSVNCGPQEEVDLLWEMLSEGGEKGQCGWLKDKFGLSWQIVPSRLGELLGGPDADGAARAMQAMLKMTKLDIQGLEDAYHGIA